VNIFRGCPDIVHISLPRNHTKQIKGFAFIEFATTASVQLAMEKDNSVPGVFMSEANKVEGKLVPIRVMTKLKWLEYKLIYKDCKKTLFQNMDEESKGGNVDRCRKSNDLVLGCLIRLSGIPEGISKQEILIKLRNYKQPCFVDFVTGAGSGVVRFYTAKDRAEFLGMLKSREGLDCELVLKSSRVRIEEICGEEEKKYLEKVRIKKDKLKKETKK